MLVLGWLTVLVGVFTILWADGAFAKRRPRPDAPRAIPLNRAIWLCRGQFPLGSSVWTKGLENFFKSFYATHASADSPGNGNYCASLP